MNLGVADSSDIIEEGDEEDYEDEPNDPVDLLDLGGMGLNGDGTPAGNDLFGESSPQVCRLLLCFLRAIPLLRLFLSPLNCSIFPILIRFSRRPAW
jgi:hypothetical protein